MSFFLQQIGVNEPNFLSKKTDEEISYSPNVK